MLKEECISIDSMVDIRQFDMEQISDDVVPRLNFGDLELAYEFGVGVGVEGGGFE